MRHAVGSYHEDNRKTPKIDADDCGLPESPIYSNFSQHLWRRRTRREDVLSPGGPRENTEGPRRAPSA
jgi:hypothetical protein